MARKHHLLRLGGENYRLRLTSGGLKELRTRFGQTPMELLTAAGGGETELLTALLGVALSWPDSGNPVTDGEAFYDLLVDEGYAGQEQFAGLALDIGVASGVLTREQAERCKAATHRILASAFDGLDALHPTGGEAADGAADRTDGENPITPPIC